MARFDVHEVEGNVGYLLDCQADILSQLDSRLVVPLLPRTAAPPVFARLNPVFTIAGEAVVMVTQSASAVPIQVLRRPVVSLAEQRYVISNALDMLFAGY